MKLNKYYAACLTAFIIWGFVAFPLRALADYPSPQILYFRIMVAAGLLVVVSVLFRQKEFRETYRLYQAAPPAGKRQFLLYTLLGGLFLGINWLAFIYVINHVDIQTASFSNFPAKEWKSRRRACVSKKLYCRVVMICL